MTVVFLVVGSTGRVQKVKIMRPLGLGMDDAAVKTVKTWKFKPATRDGKPVPFTSMAYVHFKFY